MKFKSINRTVLHDNIFQLLFVFTAFAVMAFAANFFIGRILIDHALHGAQAQLVSAEANINAGFTKAETTLLNSSYIIREMTERNVSGQELVNYITATSKWLGLRDQGQSGFSALYAYINGEIYNGTGLAPGDGFDPKEQPWYQTAMECGDLIAYTAPYTDKRTGNAIISVVKNILGSNGEQLGILVVDLNTGWLEDYVKSFSITPGGYGILLGRNITIMAHPDSNLLGHPLEDMGGAYGEIARTLKNGQDVLGRRIKNPDGGSVVVFFREIFNGWYVGNVVPFDMFYRDLHISAMILAILGVTLAAALCGILLRLSAAKHRSDEESKYKSSFIANMSHEIRTPMNAITGMAELLLREDLPQKSRDYIIDIRQASVSLLAIINDLLDFSKIESGKLEIVSGRYDLPSLVNNVMSIINIRLMEKPIEFVSSIDADVPAALIGDEVRIQEVLINLLSNAVKYTNIGQIRLNIACEQWEVPQNQEEPREKKIWLKMDVCDTGIGIKTEDREKIFRTYIQADKHKNRKIEGTGLGLPITSMLCKAMGGSINFRSEYGKGSTFTVRIPQEIQTDGTGLPENRQGFLAPGKITSFTIPDSRILVADDILTNLKVSEGLLEPYKAKIDTSISGRGAVELARKNKYDIIFMDHMMPEMDGI
ncbi:MAG: ATP-binding protein, partial [Treponema sp.]|nr:ATP-binding protein [Treponema sp.]